MTFIVIPEKRVFPPIFCATCDAKNGLKFFWSKMVEIGSITFSITYFSQFFAVYYGMRYYILEQVKCYGSKHSKKTLSLDAYVLIYTKCWPKVNIVLTIYFIEKFDVQKHLWTFSGLNIFIRTKDTVFWSLLIFCFWKKEKSAGSTFGRKG